MKKFLYIALSVFLGVLVSMIAHVVLETPFLWLVERNPEKYMEHFWWVHWSTLHDSVSLALLLGGVVSGFFVGRRWWRIVYERDGEEMTLERM